MVNKIEFRFSKLTIDVVKPVVDEHFAKRNNVGMTELFPRVNALHGRVLQTNAINFSIRIH